MSFECLEQRRIVSELDAEAAQMEAVRGLLPRFEAKSNASSTACGATEAKHECILRHDEPHRCPSIRSINQSLALCALEILMLQLRRQRMDFFPILALSAYNIYKFARGFNSGGLANV